MPTDDYIKRSDAIDSIKKAEKWWWNADDLREYREIFESIPAADVAPVVRCADCQYYEKRCPSEDIGWCNRPGAGCGQPQEFYCAGAERKEADNV